MAFDLSSISSAKRIRAPRIVLLGVEKVGKSTFAAGSDNPVFIPIVGEEGIDSLETQAFPTAKRFADVIEALGSLAGEDHGFNTVVIDSASALEPLIWKDVCDEDGAKNIEKVGGGYAKGYTLAVDRWREITEALDYLRAMKNMTSIIVGHVKSKVFNDPMEDPYDTFEFDIHTKAANLLYRWSDAILFARPKIYVKEVDKAFGKSQKRAVDAAKGVHKLYTKKRPAHPGGGRGVYGELPYELDLSWAAYSDAVSKAIEASEPKKKEMKKDG